MTIHPSLSFSTSLLLGCSLASCCMITKQRSQVRTKNLQAAHFSFIDKHTLREPMPAWDEAAFRAETMSLHQQFENASAAETRLCPARMALVKQARQLLDVDISLVDKNHQLGAGYATREKKQIETFYSDSTTP
jgi:hypothetical protein